MEQYYRLTLSDAISSYGYQIGVVYRIYCDQTGCSYIGQTRDINKNQQLSRIKSHYTALKKGCHPCSKLQAAWDATAGESIKDEILEVIAPVNKNRIESSEKMAQAEKHWQKVYNCCQNSSTASDRYYQLKAGELKKLRDAGIINNATFVYFILKLKNPWCDRPLHIKPLELSIEWDIPESSVYEAIAKLKDSELVSIEQAEIVLRWNHSANSQQDDIHDSQQDCLSDNPESLQEFRMGSEISESTLKSQNQFQDFRTDSEISENCPPEPLLDKASTTLHTIQTYSNFFSSLSEEERENFIEFGKKKAAELPKPPALTLRWIESNFEELRSQWEKLRGVVRSSNDWESDPRCQEWLNKIRSLGFAKFIYENGSLDKQRKEFYEWANFLNLIWGNET